MSQRFWEDVVVGEELAPVAFPLTVYRLVMTAGANRDFNAIHHNSDYARRTGAPDMYANTLFLQGMWERTVRDYIGVAGTIRHLRGFRMNSFNVVGDTVTVKGVVLSKDAESGTIEIELRSENRNGISVGPGTVVVTLPRKA